MNDALNLGSGSCCAISLVSCKWLAKWPLADKTNRASSCPLEQELEWSIMEN